MGPEAILGVLLLFYMRREAVILREDLISFMHLNISLSKDRLGTYNLLGK